MISHTLITKTHSLKINSKRVYLLFSNYIFTDQKPYCLRFRYRETLSEGVIPGTNILTVDAIDLDLEPKLRFFLTGDGAEHFSLDRSTGMTIKQV
jgi:hypothetical protein